ncbi:thiamine pyrophosphate-binding protein [Halococcus saccharolyticus]|uniref:Thiamine pyrophosphate protein central region n=1 Tax=Halococcus saccharolyticus DSM 5350 TaxID=1227455 RepID=M0MHB3_9EURY|nr:thiamine pyrophosphate-binding protein [Halococcus saccharolyticus]EMA43820.1 thiamine pyrophosphate protein central region [Halococcus saccharolyticus DSM 5350]
MMRTTDALVALLERTGIETVFGFPCEQMDPYYASIGSSSLRHVLGRSEASAALMADGYARASGRATVVDGVSGPGAAYIGVGLAEASGASSPVVALTGGNERDTRGNGVIQDGDNEAILDPFTTATFDAETPNRAVEALEHALRESTAGVPSPTHVNLPEDVLREETDRTPREDIDAAYPTSRPPADHDDVRAVAELLDEAERPVVVAGEGVVRADATAELAEFAESADVPVVTSMNGKGAVVETEPYALGVVGRWGFCQVANDALANADLVFGFGTRFGELTSVGWSLVPEDVPLVHVDRDPAWLGRNYEPAVALRADLKPTLAALADRANEVDDRAARIESLAADRADWRKGFADDLTSDDTPVKPQRVVGELNERLPSESVLVSATSFPGFFSGAFYETERTGTSYLQARGSDGINVALPQALGVQAALPETPVVVISGDGGIGYHIADLETAVREELPVTVIVTNNDSLGSSKMSQAGSYNVDVSTDFSPEVDYAQVARGFGCDGERIEAPERVGPAIAEALDSGRPTLLDIAVDPFAAPPLLV